MLLEILLKAK
ncbi:Protein of unknown function [Bacillus mycoides]|nr:Protein of unknown function [Bacillus mycoides]